MYTNTYYDRKSNMVHVWDDTIGYRTWKYQDYAYEPNPNGEIRSIYGDKYTKVTYFDRKDISLFERDVPPLTRTLIDIYPDSDLPGKPVNVFTFDIEVEMETGLPDTMKSENEITAIGYYSTKQKEYIVIVLDKSGEMVPTKTGKATVVPFKTERDMLQYFMDDWMRIKPEIITGWNTDFFDIPYLYNRLVRLFGEVFASNLSPIGIVKFNERFSEYQIAGVTSMDYMLLYKKFTFGELPNYRLDTVAKIEVGRGKIEYDGNLDDLFRTDINKFVEYNLVDVELVVDMEEKLQYIELSRGTCHIGHIPYDNWRFSSSYLEGAMLMHLRRKNLIAPSKGKRENEETYGKNVGFEGAYVKPPIVGKYDWIYDLDLTSLYPSIIMTLNISPDTKIDRITNWDLHDYVKGKDVVWEVRSGGTISTDNLKNMLETENYSIASNGVIYNQNKVGIIPEILDVWFNQRVDFRKQAKSFADAGDDDQYNFFNQRQKIQKVLLNSFYGVLGLKSFRLYDLDNAGAITAVGQDVIKSTSDMLNRKYVGITGGSPIRIELEDESIREIFPKQPVTVVRDGVTINILGSDLQLEDDII